MAETPGFVPVQPARTTERTPPWRAYFGERMRNSVYGLAETLFDRFYHRRSVFGRTLHIVSDPDAIGRVLLENKANYPRPRMAQKVLGPFIGNGLLTAEGEDWRIQRRIVAPTFTPSAVERMAETINQVAVRQVARWDPADTRLDMARQATDATIRVIAETLFAGDPRLASGEGAAHIEALITSLGQSRLSTALGLAEFDPSPTMRKGRKGRKYLRDTLGAFVGQHDPAADSDDFFDRLIQALQRHFPQAVADALAVDNAITFYVAGYETTSNALAWTIYLLAAQPDLQEQARAEAIAALGGNCATLADRTPLLRMILDESMRLYANAPATLRDVWLETASYGDRTYLVYGAMERSAVDRADGPAGKALHHGVASQWHRSLPRLLVRARRAQGPQTPGTSEEAAPTHYAGRTRRGPGRHDPGTPAHRFVGGRLGSRGRLPRGGIIIRGKFPFNRALQGIWTIRMAPRRRNLTDNFVTETGGRMAAYWAGFARPRDAQGRVSAP